MFALNEIPILIFDVNVTNGFKMLPLPNSTSFKITEFEASILKKIKLFLEILVSSNLTWLSAMAIQMWTLELLNLY